MRINSSDRLKPNSPDSSSPFSFIVDEKPWNGWRGDVALICSGHVNAVGIAISLREVGWVGRIICVGPRGSISELFPHICETVDVGWQDASQLVDFVAPLTASGAEVYVFLTDEALLDSLEEYRANLEAGGVRIPHKAVEEWSTVIDRRKFYKFVTNRGLGEVPKYIEHGQDPWVTFPNGFRSRVWRSWRNCEKLPRGMNIHTYDDERRWIEIVRCSGLVPEDWSFQRLLSGDPRDNVSVCGWHDGHQPLYICTRKIVQTEDNGRVVECVDDQGGLFDTTRGILTALGFVGPFEMEFVKDPVDGRFKIIELNPRFWMQHRLFAELTENALVRRCIQAADPNRMFIPNARVAWVDTATLNAASMLWVARNLLQLRSTVFATPILPLLHRKLHHCSAQAVYQLRTRFATLVSRFLSTEC